MKREQIDIVNGVKVVTKCLGFEVGIDDPDVIPLKVTSHYHDDVLVWTVGDRHFILDKKYNWISRPIIPERESGKFKSFHFKTHDAALKHAREYIANL